MAMPTINESIKAGSFNTEGASTRTPTHIVIHSTAGGASYTAKNGALDYQNNDHAKNNHPEWGGICPHYFVDDTSIYHICDDTLGTRHCQTNGKSGFTPGCDATNANAIGIEMCESNDNHDVSATTESNTIELTKYLMQKYNIPASNVWRHYDVSGSEKTCPHCMSNTSTFPNCATRWANFKAKLGTGGLGSGITDWSKALIIGDSLTVGMINTGIDNYMKNINYIAQVSGQSSSISALLGLGGNSITGVEVKIRPSNLTNLEAIKNAGIEYLIMALGTNEASTDGRAYQSLISNIQQGTGISNSNIYVANVKPCTRTNNPIQDTTYNDNLSAMCSNNGWHLIDLYSGMKDNINSYLDKDGVHCTTAGYKKMLELISNACKNNNSSGSDETTYGWEDVTKAFMKAGYDAKWSYSNTASYNISVLGKQMKNIRPDCSGLVSGVLRWFDILNENKDSSFFAQPGDALNGFLVLSFTSLDNCYAGDILAVDGHTEIYAGNKKSYNWGDHPKSRTPENNYQSGSSSGNVSGVQWTTVIRGLAGLTASDEGNPSNPFDWNLSDEQANAIIEENKKSIQALKEQGIDAVMEKGYLKMDFSARLNDYVKYLNVHKINGIQWNPNNMVRKNFKQDFVVIVRKKLYYAASMSSEENYLRLYYFNNLMGCSVSHQVNGTGTCSFQIMGGKRVTTINNMQENDNNWVDYEHLINGLTNIDDEGNNDGEYWRTGTDDWNTTTADGIDYRNLMKAKQAKYGWRYAEKCDIEPMDEIIVFVKSRYTKNINGQYKFNKMFVGYIDTVVKKLNAGASVPTIDVTCTDHCKLLNQSYVNYSPSYMPGKFNNGYLDISFDTDKFGCIKINEPIVYGMENFKDPEVRKTIQDDFLATNIFYGLNPDIIIIKNCLAAGISKRYLEKRIEPVKIIPYLFNLNKSGYDFTSAQFKKRMDYMSEIAKICFMEFFFDEEGNAVFKIPSYVIGTNLLATNNDNNEIDGSVRVSIGTIIDNAIDVGVLTPYCNLVTPMIYTVKKGQTLRNISQDVYGHIDRAVDIQVLNLSQFQKYSTTMPLEQCDILVLKFDDTNLEARKEYRDLIAFDLTSVFAQSLYNVQQTSEQADNTKIKDPLLKKTNTVTMSTLTDTLIKTIPPEDLISFTLTDSDKDICTCVHVTGASFMGIFNGDNKILNVGRTQPSLSAIMRYGVRPATVDNCPMVATEDDAEMMCDMKLLQQMAMRYTASATVIEDSDIKVGTPIRFFSYDEHPNADTMPYADSADLAKTVFYITRINRSYKQDGVSTMTLDLVAGRTMGQESIFDMMWKLYGDFYKEREDIDIDKANELKSDYNPFKTDTSITVNESDTAVITTLDTSIDTYVLRYVTFTDINASNPPPTNKWNIERLAAIYNYFRKTIGFNKAACCGIVGSLAQETGGQFDPNACNKDASNGVTNLGIVQWQGVRADNLKKFAEKQGKQWNDLGVQLAFIAEEFKTSYKEVYNTLSDSPNTAQGAYNCGLEFASKYEVCSDKFTDKNGITHYFRIERANISQKLFENYFKNTD